MARKVRTWLAMVLHDWLLHGTAGQGEAWHGTGFAFVARSISGAVRLGWQRRDLVLSGDVMSGEARHGKV